MLAVDKNTFEAEVLKAEGFTLVDYWSDGCEPCKALLPDVEFLCKEPLLPASSSWAIRSCPVKENIVKIKINFFMRLVF